VKLPQSVSNFLFSGFRIIGRAPVVWLQVIPELLLTFLGLDDVELLAGPPPGAHGGQPIMHLNPMLAPMGGPPPQFRPPMVNDLIPK
jgi:hypothetical protein